MLDATTRSDAAAQIVIEIGAGEVGRFSEWAALVDLDEELGEFGFHAVVFVPFTAEAEAVRQAHRTIERLTTAIPGGTKLTFRHRRTAMANCLARHAARRVSDPGRTINYGLKPSLVRSAFDSCRTGPITAAVGQELTIKGGRWSYSGNPARRNAAE